MPTHPHRILVIDDDLDEQYFTQKSLKQAMGKGSSMHLASSGDEAISYLIGEGKYADRAKYPFPTLIITDLNMPSGDGFDVLEFLQYNPAWNIVPRIVLSNSNDDDDVRTAYLLGASIYHVKPSEPAAFDKVMRDVVEYWSGGQVAPVDETGRILVTKHIGRRGSRYRQPEGGSVMKRPPSRPIADSLSK